METKECQFNGTVLNGFIMLFVNIAVLALSIYGIVSGIVMLDFNNSQTGGWLLGGSLLLLVVNIIMWCGFLMLEPNEARVLTWFGQYSGTFTRTGYYWVNPFYTSKKVSRAYQGERQGGQPGDDWSGAGVETEGHLQGPVRD